MPLNWQLCCWDEAKITAETVWTIITQRITDLHQDQRISQGCSIRDFRLYVSHVNNPYMGMTAICSILFKFALCIVNRWSVLACKCPFGSEHESKSIWRAFLPTADKTHSPKSDPHIQVWDLSCNWRQMDPSNMDFNIRDSFICFHADLLLKNSLAMLKTVVLLHIFVETETFYYSGFFDE